MSNFSTEEPARQGAVGLPAEEKFPWVERKKKGFRLARLYELAGMPDLAEKAASCSSWLGYSVLANEERKLYAANFCKLRLCPLCTARKAKKLTWNLSRVMDAVEVEHKDKQVRFIFLTLTIKNCQPLDLSKTLDAIMRGWKLLCQKLRFKRAVGGWFRAVEVTRNPKDKTFHPHIHAILAVPESYFHFGSGLWITHTDFVHMWEKSMKLSYAPGVFIEATWEGKDGKKKSTPSEQRGYGTNRASKYATREAAKYPTKDSEFINPNLPDEEAAEVVRIYTEALRRRRMSAFGGWMKDAARRLNCENPEDGDLVHIDEDSIREDVAVMLESYRWNFGVGDYVLEEIIPLEGEAAVKFGMRGKRKSGL